MRMLADEKPRFRLETQVLHELYTYCWYDFYLLRPCLALIIRLQRPRCTYEGREATQEAQYPLLPRIPPIPHDRSCAHHRHRSPRTPRGVRFTTQHALARHPGPAHPILRRPTRLRRARRGDAQHPRRTTRVVGSRREFEGAQGRNVRQAPARAAVGRKTHRDGVDVARGAAAV
jgi:hypothetical protein